MMKLKKRAEDVLNYPIWYPFCNDFEEFGEETHKMYKIWKKGLKRVIKFLEKPPLGG